MSANLAWNDGKVARTRHRPRVRGALSLPAASTFDVALALFPIPLPRIYTLYAIPIATSCLFHPLSKHWTNYPQVVLAVLLSSGVFMGAAVPLPFPTQLGTIFDYDT